MARIAQDRLVRKEVALGAIRERPWPENHIGLANFAPFKDVISDDVIFQYVQDIATGLAPARAEDAESEMAGKEDTFGEGRASIIDWAIKDHYDPSDIQRFQEYIYLQGKLPTALPLTAQSVLDDFNARVARDTAVRRRKLDNRMEWMIMQALWLGHIAYNDGKILFDVSFSRPAGQTNASTTPWSLGSSDPIGDIITVQNYMFDTYGVTIDRALTSRRVMLNMLYSDRFKALAGFASTAAANSSVPVNSFYQPGGWNIDKVVGLVEAATGVKFLPAYDAVYWTRGSGAKLRTQKRFSPEDKVLFLPSDSSVNELDDAIGFGKTLTSPHPEGNWTSGYYEWEKDTGPDPWGYDIGAGIKAFPVFPHLDLSYVLKVIDTGSQGQIGGASVGFS